MIVAILDELIHAFALAAVAAHETETIVHTGPPVIYLVRSTACSCGQCLEYIPRVEGETLVVRRTARMLMVFLEAPPSGWRARIGTWIQPS